MLFWESTERKLEIVSPWLEVVNIFDEKKRKPVFVWELRGCVLQVVLWSASHLLKSAHCLFISLLMSSALSGCLYDSWMVCLYDQRLKTVDLSGQSLVDMILLTFTCSTYHENVEQNVSIDVTKLHSKADYLCVLLYFSHEHLIYAFIYDKNNTFLVSCILSSCIS